MIQKTGIPIDLTTYKVKSEVYSIPQEFDKLRKVPKITS